MNVAFDPWVPLVTTSGKRELASLAAVFSEGDRFADLAVRPHERVALMRLFTCVAHAALDGPKSYDDWCKVPETLPQAILKYLTIWEDSFELFHETKPWLQVAELDLLPNDKENKSKSEKAWSPLHKLCFTRSSGNNSTLFDHGANDGDPSIVSDAEIALNLLTFQNFFVAGGKASSRFWGKSEMRNPPNPKGGPCAGKSILFTFLRGGNLSESLHLNLNTHQDLKFVYGEVGKHIGRPIWEIPISSPDDKKAITNATRTHLGRLIPQTRILRINKDRRRVLLGAGFSYPKLQDKENTFYPDIFSTTMTDANNERRILSAKPNIASWRELHSLIVRRKNSVKLNGGSLCLLNIPDGKECDIIVNAMMTNPKQVAEIVDLIESVFHIPARLFTDDGIIVYEDEVGKSVTRANCLSSAIEIYRKEIDSGWEGRLKAAGGDKKKLQARLHEKGTTYYWTSVEKNLPLLMAHVKALDTDDAIPTRNNWRKLLYASARDAYELACGHETPRQRRAFARGWQKLTFKKEKSETNTDNNMEESP